MIITTDELATLIRKANGETHEQSVTRITAKAKELEFGYPDGSAWSEEEADEICLAVLADTVYADEL